MKILSNKWLIMSLVLLQAVTSVQHLSTNSALDISMEEVIDLDIVNDENLMVLVTSKM